MLGVVSALTVGSASMRERPGQFTMFSPSDNGLYGYPSHEESGIWLFNMAPRATEQRDMWVRLTPLREGWIYEGWMVRDIDTPQSIWLSYGKFLPDAVRTARFIALRTVTPSPAAPAAVGATAPEFRLEQPGPRRQSQSHPHPVLVGRDERSRC